MKFKRIPEPIQCPHCKKLIWINQCTVSAFCNCGKYICSDELSRARKQAKEEGIPIVDSNGAPALLRVDEAKRNYSMFRDEHEIRADLYTKGIRRDTVGPIQFQKILKSELKRNKCYRGESASGC